MSEEDLRHLSDALYFQLNERMSFVKPKEPIVAKLLFNLGEVAFLLGHYYDAIEDYKKALTYGHPGLIIEDRIIEAQKLIDKRTKEIELNEQNSKNKTIKKQYNSFIIISLLGFSILLLAKFIAYRKK